MLLLMDGTSMFSDFGGVIQKRFKRDVSERMLEIKKELAAAGVIDDV